jgi:RimJ/RimL family protein N-acetyltransferase
VIRVELPEHLELADDTVALRPWTLDDVPTLTVIWQDGELQRRFAVEPPVTHASTAGFVRGVTGAWREGAQLSLAIEVGNVVVGGCDIDEVQTDAPQVGYWLGAAARGRGFATRASALLVEWAHEALAIRRLEMEIEPDTHASIGVADRLGFTRMEGVERRDGNRLLRVYERVL